MKCIVIFLQNEKFVAILLVILLFNVFANGALLPPKIFGLQNVYLVRCLTHISHRYFPPGRSLMISSPVTYRDVQQELIAEIHRNAIWPVVVTVDGNNSLPDKTDFIDRDGSYIILIPDGKIKSLEAEFTGLAHEQKMRYTRIWNSEAQFVVAGANKFSMLQRIKISNFFSYFGIFNCIIVSLERYVFHKIYSRQLNVNGVKTGMKLAVYTWFPYQSSDRCTAMNDITLLDSWFIFAQGHITKNTDLFPGNISKSLNG
jgi:hypothetical protein